MQNLVKFSYLFATVITADDSPKSVNTFEPVRAWEKGATATPSQAIPMSNIGKPAPRWDHF